jgi:hypothetical protein
MGELIPIVAIMATASVIIAWLNHSRGRPEPANRDENVRLVRENDELHRTIDRLEQRLAVLERIATDPAERTAREIENLR